MGSRTYTIPGSLHRLRALRNGPACLHPRPVAHHGITEEARAQLHKDFLLWWDSWVAPEITFLEARAVRRGPKAKRMATKHATTPVPAGTGKRHEDDRDCSDDTMIGYRGETEH